MVRTILHVDLDAFYASVEQRDRPELRGLPVIVGGHHSRGVVCAASYEARPFGVRSAMPMAQAVRLCPQAVVLPVRMDHYAEVSHQFFELLERHSPLVEGLSLDEAFLDVTGEERLLGDGPGIARRIKGCVRDELQLCASVGVAPSKFVAKIASDLRKPDGLVVVGEGEVTEFLHPLPVSRLWGVGQVTERELKGVGLHTIGDVARMPERRLTDLLGPASAAHLHALALGLDDREVTPGRAPVSVGHEDTFERDIHQRAELIPHILDQSDRVCARLRAQKLRGRTVTLKIKYADHRRVSRRTTLRRATADGRVVGKAAVDLIAAVPEIEGRGVRLTGVSISQLEAEVGGAAGHQLELDEPAIERSERLGAVLDRIAERHGDRAVQRAIHLEPGTSPLRPPGTTRRGPL
jgi:DNA polymerase-4